MPFPIARVSRSPRGGWRAEANAPPALPVAGVLAVLLSVGSPTPRPARAAETWTIHLDASHGEDLAERDGSRIAPFRTLGYALGRAGEAAVHGQEDPPAATVRAVDVLLGAGLYEAESFPIRIPAALERVAIIADGGSGDDGAEGLQGSPERGGAMVAIVCPYREVPAVEGEAYGASGTRSVSLRGISIRGGLSAMSFLAIRGRRVEISAEDCSFEEQVGTSVELSIGEGAEGSLSVRRSSFLRSGGGISVETGMGALAEIVIEGSEIRDVEAWGPDALLGAGIDVHLDPLATVSLLVERNSLLGVPAAILLTTSEAMSDTEDSAGRLEAVVAGNLVHGLDRMGQVRTRNAIYLSLRPPHEVSLLIASNTFSRVDRHVIFDDDLSETGLPPPLTFVNNICHGIGATEFDFDPSDEFAGVVLRGNLFEMAPPPEGNSSGDPCFADEAAGDLHLRPESPAVDRALQEYARISEMDLDGRCRRAGRDCLLGADEYPMDIGAYELPGFCDEDAAFFRRGDCDGGGGAVEISDAIVLFSYLFLGGSAPVLPDACDSNDDGTLNIADGIYTLSFLFTGGPEPPPPFASPGRDPSRDCLKSP